MLSNQTFFSLSYQVTRDTHLYLKDIEEREEGGTPAIVESIRAGMVFQLKQVRYGWQEAVSASWYGLVRLLIRSDINILRIERFSYIAPRVLQQPFMEPISQTTKKRDCYIKTPHHPFLKCIVFKKRLSVK